MNENLPSVFCVGSEYRTLFGVYSTKSRLLLLNKTLYPMKYHRREAGSWSRIRA